MATLTNIGKLLPISENNGRQAVSGRYLHSFLGSKQDFSTWIKNRINQYGFEENVDYEVFHKIMENPKGGRPMDEYALSIDMAKELSMVERTEKGRQARRYFIACEQKLREVASSEPMFKESEIKRYMLAANDALKKSDKKIKELEKKLMMQEARTEAVTLVKNQEMDLKNSCFYFLIKKKLYEEWHNFNIDLEQERIYNKKVREKKAEQKRLPF